MALGTPCSCSRRRLARESDYYRRGDFTRRNGIVYVATSARLSYALGEEREVPSALTQTNKRGAPVVSILVSTVVGLLAFGPFKVGLRW
jgi:amino acid transporter